MKPKKFIAQIGSNNTVKVFDASTGSLSRIINVDGNITSQPIVSENELSVTTSSGTSNHLKIYTLPSGGLKKVTNV
jgi:hypothetical protein